MTVKELIICLETFEPTTEVVFKPENSDYVYKPKKLRERDVRAFYGEDRPMVVISAEQTGGV